VLAHVELGHLVLLLRRPYLNKTPPRQVDNEHRGNILKNGPSFQELPEPAHFERLISMMGSWDTSELSTSSESLLAEAMDHPIWHLAEKS
jgi:hypothetical protein